MHCERTIVITEKEIGLFKYLLPLKHCSMSLYLFTLILKEILQNSCAGSHFTNGTSDSQMLSNLSKIAQLATGEAKI